MRNCIILGSGRSGTSMMAGMLRLSGYYLGDNYIRPSLSNSEGFFEDREVNHINEDIIANNLDRTLLGSKVKYKVRWLATMVKPVRAEVPPTIRARILERASRCQFCYKDPRFCYTLGVWQPSLPRDTRFVVVFRNPLVTAKSILRHRKERAPSSSFQLSLEDAGNIWLSMYQRVLEDMISPKQLRGIVPTPCPATKPARSSCTAT